MTESTKSEMPNQTKKKVSSSTKKVEGSSQRGTSESKSNLDAEKRPFFLPPNSDDFPSKERSSSVSSDFSTSSLFSARPSLFSSEYSASSYRGFINLMVIMLVISNFRLVVLNLLKYGVLLDFAPFYIEEWYRWPGALLAFIVICLSLLTYFLELAGYYKLVSEKSLLILQAINLTCLITIPTSLVWVIEPLPASGIIVMLWVTIVFAKMISYTHINHNLRLGPKSDTYPHNLTLKDFFYFVAAPTLCYSTSYPRSPRIRKGWLARRIAEALFLSVLIMAIVEQYIIPLVHNSLVHNDLIRMSERILKLSLPNVGVWLLGFYVFFHLYLNITAEILRFGDRQFYKDWWNSTTLQYFWKSWNIPVYQWMLSHVYLPVRRAGYSSNVASFLCFMISAVFHELIIAVPFKMFKWWSLLGMLGQLPLIRMTTFLKGKQVGNIIFWFSIVIGQPFIVLMMYRDWYYRHFGDSILTNSTL